ncbi:hypothetical protein [Phenylobacterium sp.]|jgi:hypothetical protein|uniref:hypothetical protein n=1 Tax=Phenylobacterium sp. TaxID=1871053 RepID=UPI002F9332DA
MRRRAIFSLIAACAISACAHQTTPPVAAVEGMRWIEVEGDDPKVAFGVPDSDVMVVMMTCAPRSGQVAIAVTAAPDAKPRAVELRSGQAAQRLAAVTMPSELHDGLVETAAPASGPVLASFARTGELAIGVGASPMLLPAADRQMAGRFVEACR